ncbi:MAG: hypothetical protein K1X88_22050 [Nannocystaceae bacterium]|nr:hypothetical protein [Nannocystaceae bacterium]
MDHHRCGQAAGAKRGQAEMIDKRRVVLGIVGLAGVAACGVVVPPAGTGGDTTVAAESSSTGATSGTGTLSGSSSGPAGESSGVAASSSSEVGGGPAIFDVAGGMEGTAGDTGEQRGCRKVDVVFSIDTSSSMFEEIAALAGPVFDSFPTALLDVNNGLEDFHLGIIDACNNPPFLHDSGVGGFCNYSSGKNFMVSTSPDLFDEYHCATDLTEFFGGYMGMPDACSGNDDNEQPANTAADVVSPPAVDEENDGFLRGDAVLFVVAITDEDEQPVPAQTAQQIADKLIDAKGTIDNVVFLGIGGGSFCNGPYGSASDATFMRQVADIFVDAGRGVSWDLCNGDLEGAFEAALEVVDSACVQFQPPG